MFHGTSFELVLAWTEASITAYAAAAARISNAIDRNGREICELGLRAVFIGRFGMGSEQAKKYLADIEGVLFESVAGIESPAQVRADLAGSHAQWERVSVARERFRHVGKLREMGLLHGDLEPWFAVFARS
ncbi:Hypothetical protein CAP_5736 [Chondromyces apiculatus DSM 436]|uniref:Uncharacterized protein n=1 Tax=Chondromyces apiculatus DSM 436 TaxID=1192034 RepID=A0A017T2K9_9BACT|nr:Hypothetical protein CAP_5736 [Chondromyces apiculatus DSM 436]